MTTIHIALGSNIDPENNIKAAVTLLREQYPHTRFSSVYRSAPLHHADQQDFLNAVAAFEAENEPEFVYNLLRHIEQMLGKHTLFRFGPRAIDLDLLLHGSTVHPDEPTWKSLGNAAKSEEMLLIPHPRMHERRFVLEPLIELLEPNGKHPMIDKTWDELLKETMDQRVEKMRIAL